MSEYAWRKYAVRVTLGPERDPPLTLKRKIRRWVYRKTGWESLFWPGDWMTERQGLASLSRLGQRWMHEQLTTPFWTP